jgi:hypothetical protein
MLKVNTYVVSQFLENILLFQVTFLDLFDIHQETAIKTPQIKDFFTLHFFNWLLDTANISKIALSKHLIHNHSKFEQSQIGL